MGFYMRHDRPDGPPPRNRTRRLILAVLLILGTVKIFANSHPGLFAPAGPATSRYLPIITAAEPVDDSITEVESYHFTGSRVSGNGSYLDLGDRHFRLPLSLISGFLPDEMILPSCLTEAPPAQAPQRPKKPLPVREDWPGFYGAPWTAELNGNLIALLEVYVPRNAAAGVPAPEFQIYPNYNGQQAEPAFTIRAPAKTYRGSKAILYRLFLNGPVRCLDLVVQNGENNGTGHLYFQKYHHYYESDAEFKVQQ